MYLLCMWLTACTDPFAKEEFVAYEEQPIGLYLETMPQYADWVTLLKKADLFNAVNISTIKYTCFVADNEAVQAYIKASGRWKTIDDITEEEARNLLKYHMVETDYAYSALASGKLGNETVSGDYLTITFNEDGSKRYVNGVEIIKKPGEEKTMINGYAHQLKSVLNPIIHTLMELIAEKQEYSIFSAALKECGLDKYLDRREIEINKKKIRDYKAVMLVSDSVFKANEIFSLDALKARFKGDPTDVKSDFYKYIGYHIFKGPYDFAELTDFGDGVPGKNIETYIEREFVSFTDRNDSIFINPTGSEKLQFISGKYDIPGCNGFIHEVSGLMPIAEPMRYAFEWEPTEWDEFKTIPFYRTPREKSETNRDLYWFKEGETPHFRWKTIPYKEENVLGYRSEDVDWDRFRYDDYIRADLGPVGWLEFDTPTLMRGKYNIKVVKWVWYGGGKFQMYIDDIKFGKIINMDVGTDGTLDLGMYNFLDSAPHVFRFNVVGEGYFGLDRFIFTPVKE